MIDSRAVEQLFALKGWKSLPETSYKIIEIEDKFPIERVKEMLNSPIEK